MDETNIYNSFLSDDRENNIRRARSTLGKLNDAFTDDQVEKMATDFEYLINTWLTEYEKQVFDGKTLHEVIQEG